MFTAVEVGYRIKNTAGEWTPTASVQLFGWAGDEAKAHLVIRQLLHGAGMDTLESEIVSLSVVKLKD